MRCVKNEKGRSMIEMIGVLCIFAVLSIVGLVTYDYAKERFWVVNTSQAVLKLISLAKVQGKDVTDATARIALPDGVLRIEVENASRTARLMYDEEVVEEKHFNALASYGFVVGGKVMITYTVGDTETSYATRTLRARSDVPENNEN